MWDYRGIFGPNIFFQGNNVNLFCQIDNDCQKEKERVVENDCILILSLTTLLHDEKWVLLFSENK